MTSTVLPQMVSFYQVLDALPKHAGISSMGGWGKVINPIHTFGHGPAKHCVTAGHHESGSHHVPPCTYHLPCIVAAVSTYSKQVPLHWMETLMPSLAYPIPCHSLPRSSVTCFTSGTKLLFLESLQSYIITYNQNL